MKTKLSTICVAVVVLALVSAANAEVDEFTDEVAFRNETGDPQHFIDFESYGDGTSVVGQPAISGYEWENLGIVFTAVEDEVLYLRTSAYVSPAHSLLVWGERTSYVITFTRSVMSFGLYFVDSDYTSATEQIILKDSHGNTLDVFPIPPSPANTSAFRGYLSDTPIAEVLIIEDDDGEAVLLDNVMYTVPEPATLGLLALGGLALLRRKRGYGG